MKKQIILEEYDYKTLKENSDLYSKYKKENTKHIRVNFSLNRRPMGMNEFEITTDEDVPENLKHYLERVVSDMKSEITWLKAKQSEITKLKTELNKIPNWVKSIFK